MPKKLVVALLLAITFVGAILVVISMLRKNEAVVYNESYIWHAEMDSAANSETLVRGKKIHHIKDDLNKLVFALNKVVADSEAARAQGDGVKTEFPRIKVQKIEQQTAFVQIENDQYLTESMGSSGAQDYLAEVTYTLTENPGIKSIDFVFPAGDHAMPGLYTRESFADYRTVIDDDRRR